MYRVRFVKSAKEQNIKVDADFDVDGSWSTITRFNDDLWATRCLAAANKDLEGYSTDGQYSVVGYCAGNGVLELEFGLEMKMRGYDVNVLTIDRIIKSLSPKLVAKYHSLESNSLGGIDMTEAEHVKSAFKRFGGRRKLLFGRAYHHYLTEEEQLKLFNNLYSVIDKGDVIYDIPSSGSDPFLTAMERLHSRFANKIYKYERIDGYSDNVESNISFNINPIVPINFKARGLRDAFIKRYFEEFKLMNDNAGKSTEKLLIEIINELKSMGIKPHEHNTRVIEAGERVEDIEQQLTMMYNEADRELSLDEEVVFITNEGGIIVDIIATYTYPTYKLFKQEC